MQINKLVYGSWVLLLLCAVIIAAFNMKAPSAIGQSDAATSLGEPIEETQDWEEPSEVPPREDVQPVAFQDNTPGTLPVVSGNDPLEETKLKALRKIVSEEWPDATEDQIRIWAEDFKDIPEEGLRLMLRQKRTGMGGMPSLLKPRELPPEPSPVASSNDHTQDAIRLARQVTVANIMNRYTIGHRAQVVEFASDTHGVQIAESRYKTTRGTPRMTGNPLDLAISEGFFVVMEGDKMFFTRAGRFSINGDRRLSLKLGDRELTVDGVEPIPADAASIEVAGNGDVSTKSAEGKVALGRVRVVRFLDASRLKSVGGCLFEETPKSGSPNNTSDIVVGQGLVELSNADVDDCNTMLHQLEEWQALATRK